MCGQMGHLTRMCKQQTACVSTVGVAIEAAFCSNIKVAINGKIESKSINTAVDITIVNKETWRQIGIPDYKAADDLLISAHGDDWKLTIRVYARISYCGNGAAGDVQVTHDCRNILSKNFVMLLKLVKVQVPEASGRVVKASAPEANPDGKDHTEQKVIAKDHTEEKVIAQHDFSEETWREFKKSQCATKNCTPSRPRSARPEIIRSHGEDFSAEISSSFIIRSSFGAHEANPNGKDHTEEKVIGKDHTVEKVITEVECETEGFRDHKAPAVIENDIVKVRVPEAKDKLVKVRVPEAKNELVKAYVPEANVILVKAITPEAKYKKGVKVECEVGHSQDHNEPEALQINLVKVECEAGSARDHNAPEAKVKVRGHETNDAGYTEIFLQDRYSDIVRVAPENTVIGKSSRMEKKAKFKPISERDNPIQCDHLSKYINYESQKTKMYVKINNPVIGSVRFEWNDFQPVEVVLRHLEIEQR
ncbi:hypothetical protein PRIPAC_77537 [Pristionchus pacificus]|uniref:Uncharacterized protein n=1 Tax=Pristionchus pacificus TaxID=54126 RepID=A0A2A6BVM1_PRIPA|nr:hypothetical protein PRIPAC_77537 [Pristionchus pacificus]|eukprot:PDM69970.1 hypothetical protein PRIPAC_49182 [Pristionchus pacificus]